MSNPKNNLIKVLLIDDDEDDFLIVKNLVKKIPNNHFTLDWVHSFDEAKQSIIASEHDVYLVDYRLGPDTGISLLEWAEPQSRTQPFIILTGVGDERVERQAMEIGAADYLVKGSFTPELLSRTLRYALQRKHLEEERVQELIAINKAKDEFISVASHQLRTPATGVKQYIGMLLEGYAGDLSEPQMAMLHTAYDSNERQLQIVNDLLKVAQLDAGKVQLRKAKVDIVKLLHDIVSEQALKFRHRDQKVSFVHAKPSVSAMVDKLKLRMALENIIDNASKYSENGKAVEVSVKTTAKAVTIEVKDHGVGIGSHDQDRLFQKFSRIDNPLSTQVGGTGIGLYWTKHIIDLHGGSIKVVSKRGQGSTFVVTLPY